jgi:Tol biopolymer transport system component
MRRWLLAATLLLATAPALDAQMGPYFGQNQVQYRKFRWQILRTPHFDVHYYPELEEVARYTGQMAERSYERLRRVFGHEFRERKPIIIWGSRNEFAQNNVIGDAGEGTLGVTDALRQRNMFFFAGDMRQSEHTLTHEMVHVFQFDVFARGRAGAGLQQLSQVAPPLWFMEGMAEYVTNGPGHNATAAVMRDAALNGRIPSVQQMTQRPDLFFPYRFGESFWEYVASRWGDESIGEIMGAAVSLGIDRAFRRYTGTDLEDLGEEWKEHVQNTFLPGIAELERPRRIAQPMLTQRRTGGLVNVYVAPALSPDGRNIAFISLGSLVRAEVFLDLYLADANTGKRKARLTKSTLNPEYEELRYGYSQGAFSPDGRFFAFTAQRNGKDILYIHDVRRNRTHRRLETSLVAMIGPTWSPDGRRLVFSGLANGKTDLYMIDADGRNLRQLTDDVYGDLQPAWSPDGRWIAFASERGSQSDLETLKFGHWQISLLDLESGDVRVLPQQDGKNLNPQWAPDAQSVAFISDRTGIAQLFLFDLNADAHYQLTRFVGGITSLTEHSPAITWASQADKLAFVYQDNGDYQVWSIANPRSLKKQPYATPTTVLASAGAVAPADSLTRARVTSDSIVAAARADADSAAARAARSTTPTRRQSVYLSQSGWRPGDAVITGRSGGVSIAALNDSAALALPDARIFRQAPYRSKLSPEYVARPQIGYAQDNFGRGVFGQTAIVLSDLVGNRRLAVAGGVNGRLSEAQLFAMYSDFSGRTPWSAGVQQFPFFFLSGYNQANLGNGNILEQQIITRFISRSGMANAAYPLNRFARFEFGTTLNNIDRSLMFISQAYNFNSGFQTGFFVDSIVNGASLNYAAPYVAFVHDNSLMGATGGIYGRRSRFQVEHTAGSVSWTTYTVDYRRYDALLFSFLTFATRFSASISAGPDENEFPKFIGRPDFIRGYDRETYAGGVCETSLSDPQACSATQLLGSRVAFANAELRFPLVRQFTLGLLPVSLPPVDGLIFFDVGAAWSKDQRLMPARPANYDFAFERYPLKSYGFGIRLNLFNIALIRWDYSVPLDGINRKGYWFWTLGQSF